MAFSPLRYTEPRVFSVNHVSEGSDSVRNHLVGVNNVVVAGENTLQIVVDRHSEKWQLYQDHNNVLEVFLVRHKFLVLSKY